MSKVINIAADEKWYLQSRDGRKQLSPHCPLASNDKCPRYYASQISLNLSDAVRKKVEHKWSASDVFTNRELEVSIYPAKDGSLRGVGGFCPEVSARLFNLYCSSLRAFPDENARLERHKTLSHENVPQTDLRWNWMIVEPLHYTNCHEFSVYNVKSSNKSFNKSKRTLGPKLRFTVFKRDGLRCVYCGKTGNESTLHVDHKISIADGGTDSIENLVTACQDCNLGKGATSIRDN
jgi:HNH endonuclease